MNLTMSIQMNDNELDRIQEVVGIVEGDPLTQQDFLFSFTELLIPFQYIQHYFQLLLRIYSLQHYCDQIAVNFDGRI